MESVNSYVGITSWRLHRIPADATGIFNAALTPSLTLHGGLSLITWVLARTTNKVELKDYLWPTGMVINAWYTAVGRHRFGSPHSSTFDILHQLNFQQKALLGAVSIWGSRLAYRIITRGQNRDDDARYKEVKQEPGFWNKAFFTLYLPEAVFQSLISLPFTLPFRTDELTGFWGAPQDSAGWVRWSAATLFFAGLAMEAMADRQLQNHKQENEAKGESKLCKSGVWSIVRHPNYLGDALCHIAFPLWSYGSGLYNHWQLLGPLTNYIFLRYVGGDRENEQSQVSRYARYDKNKYNELQEWRKTTNSFWPGVRALVNPWALACLGVGAAFASACALYEAKL